MAGASPVSALRRPSKDLDTFQGPGVRGAVLWSVLLLAVACLPAWWHTTAIERRALPADAVLDASPGDSSSCPARFPIRIRLAPYGPHVLDWVAVAQDTQDVLRRAADQVADADRSAGGDGGAAACVYFDVVPAFEAYEYRTPIDILTHSAPGSNGTEWGADQDGYVLDYRIGVFGSGSIAPSAAGLSALIPLDETASASDAGAHIAAEILDVFPLSCLSHSGGVCESDPAGEASGKTIQYMRPVEIVFSLVQEDTTALPAHAELSRITHSGNDSPWSSSAPTEKPDTHQYTSWSLAQSLDLALARQAADPRTPSVSGNKHEHHEMTTGADKLAATLAYLSHLGLHHFQLTTQMLFYAPLAFEPTLDTVTWTAKEYVQVARNVSIAAPATEALPSVDDAEASAGKNSNAVEPAADAEAAAGEASSGGQGDELTGDQMVGPEYELQYFVEEQEVTHVRNRSVVEPADLQTFVNAGAWSLGGSLPVTLRSMRGGEADAVASSNSSSGPRPGRGQRQEEPQTLHMLYFVPAPRHRPLFIRGSDGDVSPSHSWVIPQWGGVVLEQQPVSGGDVPLSPERLDDALLLWDKQLRKLLGVPLLPDGSSPRFASDVLALARVHENVRAARDTLRSTARLIEQMQALGVDRHVHADFEAALSSLHLAAAPSLLSGRAMRELLRHAWDASYFATRSFLHPSMIAQLYFPDEHKYAIYTPLFAPAAVPLLVALVRLFKTRRALRAAKPKH